MGIGSSVVRLLTPELGEASGVSEVGIPIVDMRWTTERVGIIPF